jgi:MFS family permease
MASQAGMVNNLNDGLAWGLFPLFFAAAGLDVAHIGILSFTYAVWGLLQLWTGAFSDRWGRKRLIAGGMLLQAVALAAIALVRGFWPWIGAAALLGLGTAMVYPTLLAAVGDVAHPRWRGSALGIYRLWRDSGYAVGALLAGAVADPSACDGRRRRGLLTFASGLLVAVRMPRRSTLIDFGRRADEDGPDRQRPTLWHRRAPARGGSTTRPAGGCWRSCAALINETADLPTKYERITGWDTGPPDGWNLNFSFKSDKLRKLQPLLTSRWGSWRPARAAPAQLRTIASCVCLDDREAVGHRAPPGREPQ